MPRLIPAHFGRTLGPVIVHADECTCNVCLALSGISELPIRRRGEPPHWARKLGLHRLYDAPGIPIDTFSRPLDYCPGSVWAIEGKPRVMYEVIKGDTGLEVLHRAPSPKELELLRGVPLQPLQLQ